MIATKDALNFVHSSPTTTKIEYILETDNKETMNLIISLEISHPLPELYHLLEEIRLLWDVDKYHSRHVPREGNSMANWLAKHTKNHVLSNVWEENRLRELKALLDIDSCIA